LNKAAGATGRYLLYGYLISRITVEKSILERKYNRKRADVRRKRTCGVFFIVCEEEKTGFFLKKEYTTIPPL
jgi:hypothetical protein